MREVRVMRTYHPRSYSQQARRFAQRYIEVTISNYETNGVEAGQECERETVAYFSKSYRHPLITTRAAGIYGRKMREYKKKKGLAN